MLREIKCETNPQNNENKGKIISIVEDEGDRCRSLARLQVLLVLGPVTLAYFLVMLDLSIISTAIPSITSEFKSLSEIGWQVTSPQSPQLWPHYSSNRARPSLRLT